MDANKVLALAQLALSKTIPKHSSEFMKWVPYSGETDTQTDRQIIPVGLKAKELVYCLWVSL